MDLKKIKLEYIRDELNLEDLNADPTLQLKEWLSQAVKAEISYPNAVTLGTITSEGFPTTRIILIKEVLENGISFFTDYRSQKSIDLLANPNASILFFWKELDRQIRVRGTCEKISREDSEKYFQSRPKESQISAWASIQSAKVSKEELYTKRDEISAKYENDDVLPLPESWGGYILKPAYFEFWQGRPNRLHDRFSYEKDNLNWSISRLNP